MTVHLRQSGLMASIIVLIAASLLGCNAAPVPTTTPTLVVLNLPTLTPTTEPTATPVPPTPELPTLIPTIEVATPNFITSATKGPGAAATRTVPTSAATMTVKVFLVALNDNGKSGKKIGCDDSIVAVNRTIPSTSAPLTAALKELVGIRQRTYGDSGLYNALFQSNLKVAGVSVVNRKATINLTGTVLLGGTCDNPRFAAQIQETALQFPTVGEVAVTINGTPLDKFLSEKGG